MFLKIKLFIAISLISIIVQSTPFNENQRPKNAFTVLYPQQNDTIANNFFTQVKFTDTGLCFFFDKIYNTSSYTKDHLPYDLSHFMQFLEYGDKTQQPEEYTKTAIKIFHQKMKSVEFLTPEAFIEMLEQLPRLMKKLVHRHQRSAFEHMKEVVKKILYEAFITERLMYPFPTIQR